MMKPIVWTIAGSDPSGGAGMQADLRVLERLGVRSASVVTAVTSQNSNILTATHYLPPHHIDAQLTALTAELPATVVKIGMLGSRGAVNCIARFLKLYDGQSVLDPVCVATSGKPLFRGSIRMYLSQLKQLFPYLDLLTPNVPEAEAILGCRIHSHQDIERAAREILSLGVKNILIKGGHVDHDALSQDYWTNGSESFWMASDRYPQKKYRGSGCVLSSAIAAALALNHEMKDAIVMAKMYINREIRLAQTLWTRTDLVQQTSWPTCEMDLPRVSKKPLSLVAASFPNCGPRPLGLYPIVDSSDWLQTLLPLGVTTIQLRIKHQTGKTLEKEIQRSILLAKKYKARLFINDEWEKALAFGAYGVHLGQEDLQLADIKKINEAGLRLGVSTHCYYEVARAHAIQPSYIACGPIFPTTSKMMSFAPQGILNLKNWCSLLNQYPLVAIGGINRANIDNVLATGVSGVAMISAITKAEDPIASTRKLLQIVDHYQCR
ncbi:thiamine phosphate synthase [Aquicella lusitana]|uniref:Thiamine-phosphate synthase n=1 Tax=Aquicella lusitana TaxID=254246 RepID=A0A370GL00_9COXI|nr:thiamine phosphate synthase [Aquicella lusitana]RDI42563.1 thiamine-phosphate diphosphorylase [Aquicella lusitana]VVC74342.1 Thiamine-phosphate synthase [Aquicella lusitana]